MNEAASSIYTKTGDDGTTGRLFGGRLAKDDLVIEAYVDVDVDEAVAALGLARAALGADAELAGMVLAAQRQLFVVAADLRANPRARNRLTPGVSQVGPDMITIWSGPSTHSLPSARSGRCSSSRELPEPQALSMWPGQ